MIMTNQEGFGTRSYGKVTSDSYLVGCNSNVLNINRFDNESDLVIVLSSMHNTGTKVLLARTCS